MSKYDDFKKDVIGTGVCDSSGNYCFECVSLVKKWIVYNGWPYRHGNANQWNYGDDFYQWIANTLNGVPAQGDFVVLNIGKYGHIGIVDSADKNSIYLLNQNYPHGNNTDPVQVTKFTYAKVVGWLKPKNQSNGGDEMTESERQEVAEALCIIRTGMKIPHEVDFIKGWSGDLRDYAYMAVVDGPLSDIYFATMGKDNPKNEKEHYNIAFRKGELQLSDYARMKWDNDVKPFKEAKPKDCKAEVASAVKEATKNLIDPKDCPATPVAPPNNATKCNWICKLFNCCK